MTLRAQAGNTLFFFGVQGRAQSKVEANFGVFAVKLTLLNQFPIGDFNRSAIRPSRVAKAKSSHRYYRR